MPDAFAAGSSREVVLQEPPSMLLQYLRAGLPHLGSRPDTVPDQVLRLPGIRPDADQVARYCRLVGQQPGDRLPLLFPHLLGFGLQMALMTGADFPFPPLGLVHVSNEVTCTAALRVDAELDVRVHAGAVRPHPRGRVVDLITTVRQDGAPVWSETSSYLRRESGAGKGADAASTDPAAGTAAGSAADKDAAGEVGAGEGFPGNGSAGKGSGADRAGQGADADGSGLSFSARWRLPGDLGRRYASVSGDVNPIHLSAWTARPLGFPRAIAHGMWTAAAVLGSLQGRLPDALTYTVQFRKPIPLPSTVRLFTAVRPDGIAAQVRGRDGDDTVRLDAAVRPL